MSVSHKDPLAVPTQHSAATWQRHELKLIKINAINFNISE